MRHLNSFLAQGGGHLNKGGGGGVLKFHFDWYITVNSCLNVELLSI